MTEIDREAVLKAALDYASRGWRVVRLHWPVDGGRACSCRLGAKCDVRNRGKHPDLGGGWQKQATSDEAVIAGWWEERPQANVGVLLGPQSGIVDIEFDDDEGRKLADKLLGEIWTPTFRSSRSVHRIFRWSEALPTATVPKIGGLECRLGNSKAAMSVFPPSLHYSGVRYEWLIRPDEVDVAEIPDALLALLWNREASSPADEKARPPEHWERILGGVNDGSRNKDAASLAGKLLRSLVDVDDQETVNVAWLSIKATNQLNKPPLGEAELRRTFTSILKTEKRRRVSDLIEQVVNPTADEAVEHAANGERKRHRDWKLVIVRSDPPTYELYAPQFGKAEGGFITLTASQLVRASSIRTQAVEQADAVLTRGFAKAWEGGGKLENGRIDQGLLKRLMDCAEERSAPPEDRRDAIIATFILECFDRARIQEDEGNLDARYAVRLSNGDVVFPFTWLVEEGSRSPFKIESSELSRQLEATGCGRYRPRSDGRRPKLRRATLDNQEALEKVSAGREICVPSPP